MRRWPTLPVSLTSAGERSEIAATEADFAAPKGACSLLREAMNRGGSIRRFHEDQKPEECGCTNPPPCLPGDRTDHSSVACMYRAARGFPSVALMTSIPARWGCQDVIIITPPGRMENRRRDARGGRMAGVQSVKQAARR